MRSRARGGREGGHGRRVRRSVDRGGSHAVIDGESRAKSAPPPFADGGIVRASEAPDPGAVWSAVDGHSSVVIHADGRIEAEPVFLD